MGSLSDFLMGDEVDKCMKTIRKQFGLDLLAALKQLPKNEFESGRAALLNKIRISNWNNYESAVMGARLFFAELVVDRNHMVYIDRLIVQWAASKKIGNRVFFEYMVVYQDLKKKFDLRD